MPTEFRSYKPQLSTWISFIFFLILCSKSYFLMGFFVGTWRPVAPTWMVLGRDVIYTVFWAAIFYEIYPVIKTENIQNVGKNQKLIFYPILCLLALSLIVIFVQFSGPKSVAEVAQHYVRNTLLPMMIFPLMGVYLLRRKNSFNFFDPLKIFSVFSVFVSLLQIFLYKDLMWINRPTGLLGDPILNSVFILFGMAAYDLKNSSQKKIFYFLVLPSAFVLYQANSFSATLSFLFSLSIVNLVRLKFSFDKNLLKKSGLSLVFLILILYLFSLLPQAQHREGADAGFGEKISAMVQSLTCSGENCRPLHYSIRGRIESNLAPLKICSSENAYCLFGDGKAVNYYKIDSAVASLIVNWGFLFAAAYLFLFLIIPITYLKMIDFGSSALFFSWLVFFQYWIFCLFNSGFYKYPLNILFYVCVAQILTFSKSSGSRSCVSL